VFLGYAEAVLPPIRGLRPHQVGGVHVLRGEEQAGSGDQGAAEDTGGSGGLWTTAGPPPVPRLPSQKGPQLRRVGLRRAQGPTGDLRPLSGAPTDAGAGTTTVVSFRSGGQHWAVALERVQRVLAARGLLPLPDPRPGVAGLLYRDGDTVPVLLAP
jgi:hypothetical protein